MNKNYNFAVYDLLIWADFLKLLEYLNIMI